MITSKYDWQLASPSADEAFSPCQKSRPGSIRSNLCCMSVVFRPKRGFRRLLEPKLEKLHDPYLLHDMDKAVGRIRRAIEDYEQILIYGDYDADGMTSASIMKETLEQMGAEVQVYPPNRFTDGYGPNESVYKYFIEQQGISPDCHGGQWVAGNQAIAMAQAMGSRCYRNRPPLYARGFAGCICDHSSGASRCGLSLPLSSRMWCGL